MLILIVAAGGSFLLLRLSTYIIPEIICIFLTYLLGLALLIFCVMSARAGFTKWRSTSGLWAMPAVICFAFILIGFEIIPSLGRRLTNSLLDKNLNTYSRVVDDFRKGTISCTGSCNASIELLQVPSRPPHVRDIWGARCDDSGVVVLFRLNTDVPLLHEGFLFKDYGEVSNCGVQALSPEVGWPHTPYVRHIVGHWYHFSDQPGL